MGFIHTPKLAALVTRTKPVSELDARSLRRDRGRRWPGADVHLREGETALRKKLVEFYEAGKITAALCHGVAVCCGTRRALERGALVKGKTVTGFANAEEDFADEAVWGMGALPRGKHLMPWRIEDELKSSARTSSRPASGAASRSATGTSSPASRTSRAPRPPPRHRSPRALRSRTYLEDPCRSPEPNATLARRLPLRPRACDPARRRRRGRAVSLRGLPEAPRRRLRAARRRPRGARWEGEEHIRWYASSARPTSAASVRSVAAASPNAPSRAPGSWSPPGCLTSPFAARSSRTSGSSRSPPGPRLPGWARSPRGLRRVGPRRADSERRRTVRLRHARRLGEPRAARRDRAHLDHRRGRRRA
jgi:hypothetical protein